MDSWILSSPIEILIVPLVDLQIRLLQKMIIILPSTQSSLGILRSECKTSLSAIDTEYNFRKCNFHLLYVALSEINWAYLSQCSDINDAVSIMYKALNRVFEMYVPEKKATKYQYPPWFNGSMYNQEFKAET